MKGLTKVAKRGGTLALYQGFGVSVQVTLGSRVATKRA